MQLQIAMLDQSPSVDIASAHVVALNGRCSINGGADITCLVTRLARGSISVRCATAVQFADKAIFQLPHVGMLQTVVVRTSDGGFDATFDPSPESKLSIYLKWLEDSARPGSVEQRDSIRIVPARKLIKLAKPDGSGSLARTIDLSRSGVAFTTTMPLALEEAVSVGPYSGRVARLLDGGAAIRFDQLIPEDQFDEMIDLS